jgi:hypothetical protein
MYASRDDRLTGLFSKYFSGYTGGGDFLVESREQWVKITRRLVRVFRLERKDWKIVHSGISIPYYLVRDGEVYPFKGLYERNRELSPIAAATWPATPACARSHRRWLMPRRAGDLAGKREGTSQRPHTQVCAILL